VNCDILAGVAVLQSGLCVPCSANLSVSELRSPVRANTGRAAFYQQLRRRAAGDSHGFLLLHKPTRLLTRWPYSSSMAPWYWLSPSYSGKAGREIRMGKRIVKLEDEQRTC